MGFSIAYQKVDNFGVFRLKGEKTFEEAMVAWEKFLHVIRNDQTHGILVFDDSISQISPVHVITIEAW
jgi:hypothetical protein